MNPNHHRITVRAAAIFCLLLVSGCASKVYHHPALETVPSAPSAAVYFFREDVETGMDKPLPVYLNDTKLLQLTRATYAIVTLKPGIFSVEVRPEDTFPWEACGGPMEFMDGQTYFLLIHYETSGLTRCFSPNFITEDRARSLMDAYVPVRR
jgi:hypothetical protein